MKDMKLHHGASPLYGADAARAGIDMMDGPEKQSFITQILTIAKRRRLFMLCTVVAAILLGLVVTLLMTPQYSSKAVIEIQREGNDFIDINGSEARAAPLDQEFYQTQYGLLQARSLAERVATQLRLYDDANFFNMLGDADTHDWFEEGRPIAGAPGRDQRIREAGEILLDNFAVAPERLSRLVSIHFTSPDPAFSMRVIDAWTANFIQATLERRFEATSHARRFLEERLVQLRTRIDESERILVGYAAREGIVNLPVPSASSDDGAEPGERSLVADDLANLNRALAEATIARVQAESRLGSEGGAVTEALDNQAISGLRERRAAAAADYARMMTQFEPDYPPAVALQTQIQQLDRSIAAEEARVQRTLREAYDASVERERELAQRVEDLKSSLLDFRRRSIQYNIYQRDVDTNRQLYDALLQRYKEIGVAGGVGVNNISVVDSATTPEKPSSPNIFLNVSLALILGLALGIGGAFVLEQVDHGISDPSEVESSLGFPLLGAVPKAAEGGVLDAIGDPKSAVSEAYLSLLTTLSFSTDHGLPRSIVVTSAGPAEGKSITSEALARSISRSGRRVLLVDADMRSPSIHHSLGVENDVGLSNYLSGGKGLGEVVFPTSYERLSVITAGPQPPSAPELLSSERLKRLLSEIRDNFDHVILDAPPLMGLADAPLLAREAEATVFVVEAHRTQRGNAKIALGRLVSAKAQVAGVVLTKFNSARAHFGYGYNYGYGYGQSETLSDRADARE